MIWVLDHSAFQTQSSLAERIFPVSSVMIMQPIDYTVRRFVRSRTGCSPLTMVYSDWRQRTPHTPAVLLIEAIVRLRALRGNHVLSGDRRSASNHVRRDLPGHPGKRHPKKRSDPSQSCVSSSTLRTLPCHEPPRHIPGEFVQALW
jgi:hypothetical protein